MKTSVIRIIYDALVGRRVLAKDMSRPGTVTNVEVSRDGAMRRVYLSFAESALELKTRGANVRPDDVLVIDGDETFEIVEDDEGFPPAESRQAPGAGYHQNAEYYQKIAEVVKLGYGGMLPNGNLVDRREHPDAMPIQKNTLLGAPEPKPVGEDGRRD